MLHGEARAASRALVTSGPFYFLRRTSRALICSAAPIGACCCCRPSPSRNEADYADAEIRYIMIYDIGYCRPPSPRPPPAPLRPQPAPLPEPGPWLGLGPLAAHPSACRRRRRRHRRGSPSSIDHAPSSIDHNGEQGECSLGTQTQAHEARSHCPAAPGRGRAAQLQTAMQLQFCDTPKPQSLAFALNRIWRLVPSRRHRHSATTATSPPTSHISRCTL